MEQEWIVLDGLYPQSGTFSEQMVMECVVRKCLVLPRSTPLVFPQSCPKDMAGLAVRG